MHGIDHPDVGAVEGIDNRRAGWQLGRVDVTLDLVRREIQHGDLNRARAAVRFTITSMAGSGTSGTSSSAPVAIRHCLRAVRIRLNWRGEGVLVGELLGQ